MQNFAYWYTYYDSVFLKQPPSLPYTFFHEVKLATVLKKSWIHYPQLPELPHLLADLQAFLLSNIWKQCSLEEAEAKTVQVELNNLMTLVQVQKIYVEQFWPTNKRRIEASFVHYYIFLKRLILCLIPVNCSSLSKAIQLRKFCLQMKQIEKLINHLLDHLPTIYNFLTDPFFGEEEALIIELFQDITNFCKNLPKLTRNELEHIPKLVKYICLNNSLESLNNDNMDNVQSPLRRRATNQSSHSKIAKPGKDNLVANFENLSASSNGRRSQKINIENKSQFSPQKSDEVEEGSKQIPKLFKFQNPIFRDEESSLNMTNSSKQAKLFRKDSSPTKQKDRMRSSTILSFFNSRKNTIKGESSQKRDTMYTDRQRLFTRTTSFDNTDKYKNAIQWYEEQEQERKQFKAKPKPIKLQKTSTRLTMTNLQTGQLKGWALIRESLFKRVAEKKLKKLLFS